jgi:cobalt transporter subunit CbtA
VNRLRKLIVVVFLTGVLAGLLLFVIQRFTIFPLIAKAEIYESADEPRLGGTHHDDQEWRPADGVERTLLTAVTTMLSGIAFSALLFSAAAFKLASLDLRKGAMWGLGAFVCVDLAPAWGLPPQPPGVAVADLFARQTWWVATVISTAIALWLVFGRRKSVTFRLVGIAAFVLPHAIGAPVAVGHSSVPAELIHRFILLSILTMGVFWLSLGSIGGWLYHRFGYEDGKSPTELPVPGGAGRAASVWKNDLGQEERSRRGPRVPGRID